jgi:hypothetical protein
MIKLLYLTLLSITLQGLPFSEVKSSGHTLTGKIYFTNNTPRNYDTFPVELYTRSQKRRLISSRADASGGFELKGVKPGKYLLKFTWPPNHCTLWYRVAVPADSNKKIRVIMDAACSSQNGAIQDLSES